VIKPKRIITGLQILTVSIAKAGTGKNPTAGVVLVKAGVDMTPEETQAALDALKAKLGDEEMALVMALIEAGKQAAPAAKADEPKEPEAKAGEEPPKDDSPEMAKANAVMAKAETLLAKAHAERDALQAEIAKRDDAEVLAGFVAKAKSDLVALPGAKPEDIGVLLKAVSDKAGPDTAAQLVGVLATASGAIAKSGLLKAVGSSEDSVGTASGDLQREIAVLCKAHPGMTPSQAHYQVMSTNPRLAAAACKEG
jgi:hypothetical protein